MTIADLRQDYRLHTLDMSDVDLNPLHQFKKWFEEAVQSEILEPNAMVLATATTEGKPSARVVLLKDIEAEGFVFFTNYDSRKGEELAANPQAALCFNWLDLQRQVRIEGLIEKIDPEKSDAYFQSRPLSSQIGAWASPQSRVIAARDFLEKREDFYKKQFQKLDPTASEAPASENPIPRPSHWGGYVLKPSLIEFWQGRSSRLHDRIQYSLKDKTWLIERLAP
jgi:pyridoxamine 5'-phosphate oxidase